MTWNLWWRFGPWERRHPIIVTELRRVGADVIGLQEVWAQEDGPNQAEDLAAALGYRWVTAELRYWQGLAFTNAILSRWPILDSGSERLVNAEGEPGHRSMVWAEVDAPVGPVLFVTAHLDWQFDASAVRSSQLGQIARFVAARRGDPDTAFPTVFCGDLNAVAWSDELRALTGAAAPAVRGLVFTDAWSAAATSPGTSGGTSEGWTFASTNPYLVDASWPNRRIDYVLVSWPRPKPLGSVVRCELAGTEAVDGVAGSDHFAVVADLRTDRG